MRTIVLAGIVRRSVFEREIEGKQRTKAVLLFVRQVSKSVSCSAACQSLCREVDLQVQLQVAAATVSPAVMRTPVVVQLARNSR